MGMKRTVTLAAAGLVLAAAASLLQAAVGCDLNDPDRDVKRLFPGSTGFKTLYVSISKKGGDELLKKIEARLGDRFTGLFETADVPYTMYEIYKGAEPRRLHPRRQPEGDVRRPPGLPRPRHRGRHPGLLLPEADLQGREGLPLARLRRAVPRPEPGGFLQVRRRVGAGGSRRPRRPHLQSRARGPSRIFGPPCGRSRRTSSSSTSSSSAIPI